MRHELEAYLSNEVSLKDLGFLKPVFYVTSLLYLTDLWTFQSSPAWNLATSQRLNR